MDSTLVLSMLYFALISYNGIRVIKLITNYFKVLKLLSQFCSLFFISFLLSVIRVILAFAASNSLNARLLLLSSNYVRIYCCLNFNSAFRCFKSSR